MTIPRPYNFLTMAIIVGSCFRISDAHATCYDPAEFEARRQAHEAAWNRGGFYMGPDVNAMPIYTVRARYPLRASLLKQEGWVQIHFNVDTEGNVIDPMVVASSHPKIFDEAALAAISQYRYKPKMEGSVPVE